MERFIETLPAEAGVRTDDPRSVMRYISEFFGVRADLGRAGVPSDIGPVICFLASERNSYTTGANVNVDGGSNFFA
jgi:NAD(P)-dependent dehydrogenase (short-subunit alcohol dehydrogenase family)